EAGGCHAGAAISAACRHIQRCAVVARGKPAHGLRGLRIVRDGKRVSRNLVFFDQPKDLELPLPHIRTQLARTNDGYTLTLESDTLAREVWVSFGDLDAEVSDNAFDILPGQQVTLTIHSSASLDVLRKALKLQDVADATQGRAQ